MPYTLFFIVISNINVMVAESTGVAQVEDPTAGLGGEDDVVQTLAGEPSAVEFVVASVTVEATTMTVPVRPQRRKSLLLALSLHELSWLPSLWILPVLS